MARNSHPVEWGVWNSISLDSEMGIQRLGWRGGGDGSVGEMVEGTLLPGGQTVDGASLFGLGKGPDRLSVDLLHPENQPGGFPGLSSTENEV